VAAALALARVRHPSLRDSHGSFWLLSIRHRRSAQGGRRRDLGPVAGSGRAALGQGADG
jgi:hypothetical protein